MTKPDYFIIQQPPRKMQPRIVKTRVYRITDLYKATEKQNIDLVKQLLRQGNKVEELSEIPQIFLTNPLLVSPIYIAAINKNKELLKILIERAPERAITGDLRSLDLNLLFKEMLLILDYINEQKILDILMHMAAELNYPFIFIEKLIYKGANFLDPLSKSFLNDVYKKGGNIKINYSPLKRAYNNNYRLLSLQLESFIRNSFELFFIRLAGTENNLKMIKIAKRKLCTVIMPPNIGYIDGIPVYYNLDCLKQKTFPLYRTYIKAPTLLIADNSVNPTVDNIIAVTPKITNYNKIEENFVGNDILFYGGFLLEKLFISPTIKLLNDYVYCKNYERSITSYYHLPDQNSIIFSIIAGNIAKTTGTNEFNTILISKVSADLYANQFDYKIFSAPYNSNIIKYLTSFYISQYAMNYVIMTQSNNHVIKGMLFGLFTNFVDSAVEYGYNCLQQLHCNLIGKECYLEDF